MYWRVREGRWFLTPPFQVGIGEEVGIEAGFFRSVAALFLEVLQEAEGVAAQEADGDEVDDGHECHCEINDAPRLLQSHETTHEDDDTTQAAEQVDGPFLVADVAHIRLAIEVVGDDGAVGKEEDGGREEPSSEAA